MGAPYAREGQKITRWSEKSANSEAFPRPRPAPPRANRRFRRPSAPRNRPEPVAIRHRLAMSLPHRPGSQGDHRRAGEEGADHRQAGARWPPRLLSARASGATTTKSRLRAFVVHRYTVNRRRARARHRPGITLFATQDPRGGASVPSGTPADFRCRGSDLARIILDNEGCQ
jgi:hypothetical protein